MGFRKTDFKFDNRTLVVGGRLCRVARLDADDYKFLQDPEPVIAELRKANVPALTFLPSCSNFRTPLSAIRIHSKWITWPFFR